MRFFILSVNGQLKTKLVLLLIIQRRKHVLCEKKHHFINPNHVGGERRHKNRTVNLQKTIFRFFFITKTKTKKKTTHIESVVCFAFSCSILTCNKINTSKNTNRSYSDYLAHQQTFESTILRTTRKMKTRKGMREPIGPAMTSK